MEKNFTEKNLSTNMIDFIAASDRVKIDDYLPYLRCFKCNEAMIDPKFCSTCNYNICSKCKTCSHQTHQSRHIKLILEHNHFKCKLGCSEVHLKYSDLRGHVMICKNASEEILLEKGCFNIGFISQKAGLRNSLNSSLQKSNSTTIDNINLSYLSQSSLFSNSDRQINTYEGKVRVKCPKCEATFNVRDEFIQHYKSCGNSIDHEGVNITDDFINKFYSSNQELQSKFRSYMLDKILVNKYIAINNIISQQTTLLNKKELNKNYDSQAQKSQNDEFIKEDPILQKLVEDEMQLNEKKKHLMGLYNAKIEEIMKVFAQFDAEINEDLLNYKNSLIELEIEEKWTKEDLDNSPMFADLGDKCTTCANDNQSIKKFFCQTCRGKYCMDTCIKKCKGSCTKYICQKDSTDCKLCHKTNYCDTCLKKCFFVGCNNKFCPDCYKKNEHQARNANINCKFFTCEKDQVCDCLMTSLFCSKCEKRLCNQCLVSDKEHYSILKIFNNSI
jgi:hypothetical protein